MISEPLRKLLPASIAQRVQSATNSDGTVTAVLEVSGLSAQQRGDMEAALRDILLAQDEISDVKVVMTAERKAAKIIAIGSGKGGVGKSTLTANLALALKARGVKVGLVDADIYGPSQPMILGNLGERPEARDEKLVPVASKHGIDVLSMGHLVEQGQAIAWRGPMAGNALSQMVDAHWGETELLLVDLPPGTGDVQLTMLQKFKPSGAVLVSTPQDLALIDAARAGQLFDSADVPIIGLVENMAGYICPHCGEVSDPFGSGGVETAAERLELPFLGRIPLAMDIRTGGDTGEPVAAGSGVLADPFHAIAGKLHDWLSDNG